MRGKTISRKPKENKIIVRNQGPGKRKRKYMRKEIEKQVKNGKKKKKKGKQKEEKRKYPTSEFGQNDLSTSQRERVWETKIDRGKLRAKRQ